MKKQLIILSALLAVGASQGSFYDRMKAAAQQKYDAAKRGFSSAKTQVQQAATKYMPQVQQTAAKYMPQVKTFVQQAMAQDQPLAYMINQGVKLGSEQLRKMGILESTIDKLKQPISVAGEKVYGSKEQAQASEDDAMRTQRVSELYKKQQAGDTNATLQLQEFFDSPAGQEWSQRHVEQE